jgi:hypothetical protein
MLSSGVVMPPPLMRRYVNRGMTVRWRTRSLLLALHEVANIHTILSKRGELTEAGTRAHHPASSATREAGCDVFVVGRSVPGFSLWAFPLQNTCFCSGGTQIRTGGTMIFRSVQDPTVHRHRAP